MTYTLLTSDNSQLSEPTKAALEGQIEGHEQVCERVLGYLREALSPNTRKAYRFDLEHFLSWGGTIPSADHELAMYLADHAGQLSIATLKRRLVALGMAHAAKGLQNPTKSALVQSTLKGIKRAHGTPQRRTKPLLVADLIHILNAMGDSAKDIRDRALLLVGFAGGFRRSELVALDREDVETVRQGLIVTIRRSKTDQDGTGRKIGIPFARGKHCPVHSLEHWLEVAGIETGPMFRPVCRHGHITPNRLSGEAVSAIVKARADLIGLRSGDYSGHSLRSGLATSAAMAGVSSWKIRQQTGHASEATLSRYIRDGELFVDNAAAVLL